MSRNKENPELFEIQINNVQNSFNADRENEYRERFGKYLNELNVIKRNIQTQIDILLNDKPTSSEKVFKDLKDIYFMSYMNNFALFVGFLLVCRYLFLYTSVQELFGVSK